MSNRDFGVVALGRFLAVERYYETHVSPWANQPGKSRPGLDRRSRRQAELEERLPGTARPQHG
jgi:hypothetical protein